MSNESQKQIIILVDDNPVSLKTGKVILKDRYQVFAVPSGEKLFELLANIRPDLILLDVDMPDMDGYEVIRRLKSQDDVKDIPVIFLSALDEEKNELEGLNLGAIDYFTKPFSAPILLQRIETYLNITAQAEELRNAKLQAEAANHALNVFSARMSREMQEPLRAIIEKSKLLKIDKSDSVQQDCLKDIQDSAKSLLTIIGDTLDE